MRNCRRPSQAWYYAYETADGEIHTCWGCYTNLGELRRNVEFRDGKLIAGPQESQAALDAELDRMMGRRMR